MEEQLQSLKKSGLLEKTTELLCFICKFEIQVMKILKPYKNKIKFIVTDENLYERFALQNFRHYIQQKEPYYMYYFHTKGVSHNIKETNFHNIRRNLDYFILEKHEICLYWLDHGYDVVGTALSLYPALHFSGNFWWVKSEHLDRLPASIRNTYYAPEMYICSHPNGKYISICQHTNHGMLSLLRRITDENILKQSTTTPIQNVYSKHMKI
jgi:hypothetical protein